MVPWYKNMTSVFATIFVLYFQIQLMAHCQQVFLDPKKFLGVASVADAVEYLHSGRSVGKVRRFIRACNNKQTNLFYCCSNAACNFQCYLFRSLFAWIHPTARPLLSCSVYLQVCRHMSCTVNRRYSSSDSCSVRQKMMTTKSHLHWCVELRRMFRLGSI